MVIIEIIEEMKNIILENLDQTRYTIDDAGTVFGGLYVKIRTGHTLYIRIYQDRGYMGCDISNPKYKKKYGNVIWIEFKDVLMLNAINVEPLSNDPFTYTKDICKYINQNYDLLILLIDKKYFNQTEHSIIEYYKNKLSKIYGSENIQ